MQKIIDLKNIDRETNLLYSGSVSFNGQHVFDQSDLILSKNLFLGRHFTGLLCRRIVHDIKQYPTDAKEMNITCYPDGLAYNWVNGDDSFCVVSHDSNAMPATITLMYHNPIVVMGKGLVPLREGQRIRAITLDNRPYESREEWRKLRGDKNLTPYIASANIADVINMAVDSNDPLINFQMLETMIILEVEANHFKVGFDVMGQLYTLMVVTD